MFDRVLNTPLHWISTAFIWITTFLKTECLMLNLMLFSRYRSSRPEVFCKKVFLKFSQNSQENTCARVSFLIKFNKVVKKETLAQVFSCEFCEIFKNRFFKRVLLVAASECDLTVSIIPIIISLLLDLNLNIHKTDVFWTSYVRLSLVSRESKKIVSNAKSNEANKKLRKFFLKLFFLTNHLKTFQS